MCFSVLMSIYKNETSIFLEQCLQSIFDQSLVSDDVVIVHDGPLTNELYQVLDVWKKKLVINEIILDKNIGLGKALNIGLEACRYELVARIDTDDINVLDRFEIQYQYMIDNPNVDMCGSHIDEFDNDPNIIISKREVPIGDDIDKSFFYRNPFNHVTVMFKKSCVLDAGGYKHMLYMEDYFLWARMYNKGYKLVNLDLVFVKVRAGDVMLCRRKGFKYFFTELAFMSEILKMDVKNKPKIMAIFLIRSHIRLLPQSALKKVYQLVRH